MAKQTRHERVDEKLSKIIDDLAKLGYRRVDASKIIADKYKKEEIDYAGFKD